MYFSGYLLCSSNCFNLSDLVNFQSQHTYGCLFLYSYGHVLILYEETYMNETDKLEINLDFCELEYISD